MSHPTDNLVRTSVRPMELRSDDDAGGNTLFGHFTVFDEWTEIHSWWEGDFLERNAPGMLEETIKGRRDQIKVLVDHGADPSIGNKPLGPIRELRGDAYYEVELLDAPYVRDIKPALAAGLYGASYRFRVTAETWVNPTRSTEWNPSKLPERTIEAVELYEFGPVVFPAYQSASAGVRSIRSTDDFAQALTDPLFIVRLTERVGPKTVEQIIAAMRGGTPLGSASDAPGLLPAADGPATSGLHPSVLRARIEALRLAPV